MLILDQLRRGDRRLQLLAAVVLSGLLILLVGLWYVQVASYKRYQASLKSQTFRTVRVPGVRGKVFDRNGILLAENRPSYNLNLYLDDLRPQFQAEYWRQKADVLANTTPLPAQAPAGALDRFFARFRPAPKPGRLSSAQINELSTAVRYAVASNTVQEVSTLLRQPLDLTPREFSRHYLQWPYRPLPVLENLSSTQVARFLELGPAIPGIDLDVQPIRFYPYGPVVAHVLGYLTRDDLAREDEDGGFSYSLPSYDGAVGLEHALNSQLVGRAGVKSIVVNSLSYRDSESVWVSAEAGRNVTLALDIGLQKAAYEALRTVSADVRGAAVVMDAANGDVLALVSAPAYDPNEFVGRISNDRWAILNDPKQRPIFNRATQGAYGPGSIFKIITALACFEAGLDPEQIYRVEPDPARPGRGAYYLGHRKIEDTAPPGDYDFIRAFKRSSNSYFIFNGLRTGRDRLLEMGKRFFLGEAIGLPTRQEAKGYFPRPEEVLGLWTDGVVADVCIGQQITVTPLQMAVMTAAIANGGKVYYPRFVLNVAPAEPGGLDGATNDVQPRLRGTVNIPPRVLGLIREAMLAETEEVEGTGFKAFQQPSAEGRWTPRLPGFRVGGKTGTAEVKQGSRLVDKITWFVALGPIENPRYAVVVMVESGGSGGGTCAPVARRIFEHLAKRIRPATPWVAAAAPTAGGVR